MADQLQFGAAHASMIASGVEVNMTTLEALTGMEAY